MTRVQSAFYHIFVLATIAAWSPLKWMSYLVPFLGLFWFLFWGRKTVILRRLVLLGLAWALIILISASFNNEFIFQNALLSIMTYGAFYIPFVVPTRYLRNSILYHKMAYVLLTVIAIEAPIGTIQAAYGFLQSGTFDIANGDRVEGTVDLSLAPSGTAANRIFATNIAFALLFLIPYILLLRKRRRLLFFWGIGVLVLASVVHILVFLAISVALAFLIYRPGLISMYRSGSILLSRRWASLLTAIALLLALSVFFIPKNIQFMQVHYQRVREGKNPKITLLSRILYEVPKQYPVSLIIGLGPGQFASRGGLIGTGMYFGGPLNPRPLPLLSPKVSYAIKEYMMDLWLGLAQLERPAGSTLRPFSSWLAVISEFGFVGFFLTTSYVLGLLIGSVAKARSAEKRIWAFSFGVGIIFLFLIGLQEFYWETPQMILLGVMGLKVIDAQMVHGDYQTQHS